MLKEKLTTRNKAKYTIKFSQEVSFFWAANLGVFMIFFWCQSAMMPHKMCHQFYWSFFRNYLRFYLVLLAENDDFDSPRLPKIAVRQQVKFSEMKETFPVSSASKQFASTFINGKPLRKNIRIVSDSFFLFPNGKIATPLPFYRYKCETDDISQKPPLYW